MEIKKCSEIIESSVEYYKDIPEDNDEVNILEKATVRIEINYQTNTFNVKSKNDNDKFMFKNNSHNSFEWKAVCQAIINGIEEAEKHIYENTHIKEEKI